MLLANGPGDPGAMDAHAAEVRGLIDSGRPVFGICLGHQLVGRALGLETYKLPFGHRGANHPVLERATGRVLVTSQNHGFAVREPDAEGHPRSTSRTSRCTTARSRACACADRPVWSMQFHPEASPGPARRARSSSSASSTLRDVRERTRVEA